MNYPDFMGMAEQNDGRSRLLVSLLEIGKEYRIQDLAPMLGVDPTSMLRRGVYTRTKEDFLMLFITLKKKNVGYKYMAYTDHLDGSTLFWSGQEKMKYAEKRIQAASHDVFVFIKSEDKKPYVYYGRALPIRAQYNWEPGIPSHIVFDLFEYESLEKRISLEEEFDSDKYLIKENTPLYSENNHRTIASTEAQKIQMIRTAQSKYRRDSLEFWGNKCAVTGVDNASWLVASHIKPWRESSDQESIDVNNSLILTPNYDKLFDRGVISFDSSTGKIILPEKESRSMWNNLNRMGVDGSQSLSFVSDKTKEYLDYHRQYIYSFEPSDALDSTEDFVDSLVVNGCK